MRAQTLFTMDRDAARVDRITQNVLRAVLMNFSYETLDVSVSIEKFLDLVGLSAHKMDPVGSLRGRILDMEKLHPKMRREMERFFNDWNLHVGETSLLNSYEARPRIFRVRSAEMRTGSTFGSTT